MIKLPEIFGKLLFLVALLVVGVIFAPSIKTFFKSVGSEATRALQGPELLKEHQAQQEADQIKDQIKKELDIQKSPEK